MKTEIVPIHPEFPELDRIARCARVIRNGGLVIFPTETVYGIAADFNNPRAMTRLREVKRRPEDKLFSIHISQKFLLTNYSSITHPSVFKLVDACWPGPLTVIVPGYNNAETVGIRMPQNNIAIRLIEESQCSVAAPSANLSGNPPPSSCQEALRDLDGQIDLAIDGGPAKFGQASSVVDFMAAHPSLVREGAISQQEVDRIIGKKHILFVCTGNSCRSVMAEYSFKNMLGHRDDVDVSSAGTSVFLRSSASAETIAVLKREFIDASLHQARPIDNIMLHKADLILVMTRSHRNQVLERVPSVEKRVYLLREFGMSPLGLGMNPDIPDPMGRPAEAYEECLMVIKDALMKVAELV